MEIRKILVQKILINMNPHKWLLQVELVEQAFKKNDEIRQKLI